MATISFEALPDWAKEEIGKKGLNGITLVSKENHCLKIVSGAVWFDFQEVVPEATVQKEEGVFFSLLPFWAAMTIITCQSGSTVQSTNGKDTLQISADGSAFFNGKHVLRDV